MAARRPAAKAIREDAGERLLVEAAQRDPAKFGDLYEIHFERVYAFVARRVRERDRAEDLTSEVFHKALAGLPAFEWRGAPFSAWLIRIAANVVIDHAKRAAREKPAREDDPEPSTKAEQEEVEERARLFRMVEQLPGEQRRVIYARFVEQRSIRDIAQRLGRSEGAVKQLQFRALQKLRDRLEGAHA
jgi:RNA polymerase sigma-70 factor (ECF subfamily)